MGFARAIGSMWGDRNAESGIAAVSAVIDNPGPAAAVFPD
jgi:hypothetical protein